jgi:DNA (cytosine-5)-methyltransferase 1
MYKPIVLDIFCGAGGMSEGFIQAGFNVAFACDLAREAELTYTNRHKQLGYDVKFARMDIRTFSERKFLNKFLDGVKIDVVCGGPPCQGFSLAGKRDQNDPRNILFKNYIKTIKQVKPKYFVMENVEGILSMRFTNFIGVDGEVYEEKTVPEILINEFKKIGYMVTYKVLQANDFGVPQNRRRVFFLGHKVRRYKNDKYKDIVTPPQFPKRSVTKDIAVKDAIDDLSYLDAGHISHEYVNSNKLSEYQIESRTGRTPNKNGRTIKAAKIYNHQAARHSNDVIERFSLLIEGEDIESLRKRLSDDKWQKHKTKKLRCYKIKSNEPSPTVLTLPDDLVHYSKNRIMTVREFARLQSFDYSFEFLGKRTTGGERRKTDLPQYTQVGNAVPPLLAKAVANEIMKAYKQSIEELIKSK